MIVAWRLVKWYRRDQAFTGEGASRHPGRWNPAGLRAVYLGESPELAVLEMLVHLDPSEALHQLALIRVEIPESLRIREVPGPMPRGWNSNPPRACTRTIGEKWLRRRREPLLRVPSVLVPHASNLILNPLHGDAEKLRIGPPERYRMDLRLLK
ncbi:MAG: RES family NAD+ phosphorylase [Planctomycetes bacterium]|nr:RES family NAD+ phosphorylase [Planctomycetota bacterium]